MVQHIRKAVEAPQTQHIDEMVDVPEIMQRQDRAAPAVEKVLEVPQTQ